MMNSEPIILQGVRTQEDAFLRRLIEFFGLTCRIVDTSLVEEEVNRAANHDLCILTSATTLHSWCVNLHDPRSALENLRKKAFSLFVYGFAPEAPTYIAGILSDGQIANGRRFTADGLRYEVSTLHPDITREFSGLSFGGVRNVTDFGFVCSANARNMTPLVSIEGAPFWVLVESNNCKTFLLACSAIADIQEQVNDNVDATRYFSRLLPTAMFLRSEFGNCCWHGKRRFASFIIDDPLLKRSYGFLNYRNLVSMMDKGSFATTIAFIPANYKRTDKEVAQLFRQRPDRLSLCVHGCDHTTAEFSAANVSVLNSRVQLATARMNSLYAREGMPYSAAMVFPQGRFSPQALTALKSNNFLAAVNSSASPGNSGPDRSLAVADFLGPAVTRFGGFPLFTRRYPVGLEQFAFDLFFGKPALVVEHHVYLKDGGERLADFITALNSLGRLQWSGLQEIITGSYLQRQMSGDIVECRLYANDHVVENHADRERTFVISKRELDGAPIQGVFINGQAADFVRSKTALAFSTPIPAFSSASVKMVYRNVLPVSQPARTVAGRSRAWTRRLLAEFRDNVLSRNDFLLAGSQALHRRFISPDLVEPDR